MNRGKLGKLLMSFVLVVGAVLSTAIDWNATHLLKGLRLAGGAVAISGAAFLMQALSA